MDDTLFETFQTLLSLTKEPNRQKPARQIKTKTQTRVYKRAGGKPEQEKRFKQQCHPQMKTTETKQQDNKQTKKQKRAHKKVGAEAGQEGRFKQQC